MVCIRENFKILTKETIEVFLDVHRKYRQRIVLAPGCFDLLHLGHIRHLEQAKGFGEVLIVVVTADAYVDKGPGRPAFSLAQRMEAIAALGFVNYVIPSDIFGDTDSGTKYIEAIKPKYWVRGSEYSPYSFNGTKGAAEVEACKRVDCVDVYTDSQEVFSSTKLLNQSQFSSIPEKAREWLGNYVSKYKVRANACNAITDDLINASQYKVLVIGEVILDEYVYVEALGKSGKEPVMVVREKKREEFDGGSMMVSRHVAEFCQGNSAGIESGNWIEAPVIKKTRVINEYPFQKMFEVYKDDDVEGVSASRLQDRFNLDNPDVVIAVDYGHGLFGDEAIDYLTSREGFLALNVQANAGNFGYNTINRWRRADYLCLSENELRLAYHQKNGDIEDLVIKTAERMGCRYVTVTMGKNGVLVWGKDQLLDKMFTRVPAFTDHFVDRVGAGDAVFAVTSLLAAQVASIDAIGLVANAVGALAVQIVGNREPIRKDKLLQYVSCLLK